MRILKQIALGVLALVALLAVVGLFIPRKYSVERSVTIQAPADLIFPYVNDLKKQQEWSPWKAMDPSAKMTFGPVTEGQGASYSWEGDKTGHGTCTILSTEAGKGIETDLDFKEMGRASGYFKLIPEGTAVVVTEGFKGDAGWNLMRRYMNLIVDRMVGPVFEQGLTKLKEITETEFTKALEQQKTIQEAAATADAEPAAAVGKAKSKSK